MSGVQVDGGSQQATTDVTGAARWVAAAGTSVDVTASRAVPQSEAADTARAVDLADAIAVLQMLNAQGAGAVPSSYQAFAADFNGDGRVEQQDAVDVLRHVVGLDAPAPQWLLLDAADPSLAGREALQPGQAPSICLSPADADAHQVLVGVLRGDVDGSFTGPAGTGIGPIDPAGLAQPAMAMPTDPALFGVYI